MPALLPQGGLATFRPGPVPIFRALATGMEQRSGEKPVK